MFWDKKVKCPYCAKMVADKKLGDHLVFDNACLVVRWRGRGIRQDIYNNRMAGERTEEIGWK